MNMKRLMVIVVVVLATSLALVGLASAQDGNPPQWFGGQGMGGWMHGGGRGMGMGARVSAGMTGGPMHEYMHDALSEALGLTRDEFEAQLAAGETPWTIAEAQGLTADEFTALMTEARAEALAAAVADDAITQEQADWMLSHQMGGGMLGAGRMGAGRGQGYGPGLGRGDCPMHPATPQD
jgi:hypothetical protein